jgi:hypothetical protein
MVTWIKCTNTKKMPVYINLDNAVTVMRDDTGQRINERGTVIEFMGGQQVYIVVTEQPEEIIIDLNRSAAGSYGPVMPRGEAGADESR